MIEVDPYVSEAPEVEGSQLLRFEGWLHHPDVEQVLNAARDRWKDQRGAGRWPDDFGTIGASLLLSAYTTPLGARLAWCDAPDLDRSERKKRQRLARKWQGHLKWEQLWPQLLPLLQALEKVHLSALPPSPSSLTLSEHWQSEVEQLVTSALQDVLQHPQIGPQVLKIPPGLGKTTTLARALLTRPDTPLKVLWFLREARQRGGADADEGTSPVAEILALFPENRASAEVFEGGQPRAGHAAYIREREWLPDFPELQVRLLAHAYLPWLFGSDRPLSWTFSLTQDADLIVIDEDPLDSLVTTQDDLPAPLAWPILLKSMRDSGLLQDDALSAPIPPPAGKRGVPISPSQANSQQDPRLFPGESRVQSDAEHHQWMTAWATSLKSDTPSTSWSRLQNMLVKQLLAAAQEATGTSELPFHLWSNTRNLLRRVLPELQRELKTVREGGQATRHFGLVWTPGPVQEELVHLRFSLPRKLQFTRRGSQGVRSVPVLVLDAYAHEQRYKRVLAASTRSALPGKYFRLDVQTHTSAGQLSPLTLKKGAGRRHLVRLIIEAVLSGLSDEGNLNRSVLLLAPGAVTGTLRRIQRGKSSPLESPALTASRVQAMEVALSWLAEVFPYRPGEDCRIRPQHWFAGRGVNRFTGWDVVALTRPQMPRAAQDRLMAHWPEATPEAEQERAELRTYDQDVELLQMLNRGRQLRYRDASVQAPRVMTLFPLDAAEKLHPLLQGHVRVLPQRVTSKRPNHPFRHRQLAGLTIPRGKLELTKLVTLAVVMELLHRPQVNGLPPGWFPEEVLVVLGLLSPGPAAPSALSQAFLSALRLEEINTACRVTASAWAQSKAGTGLWSPRLGDGVPWVASGSVEYLITEVTSVLRDQLDICTQRFRMKDIGRVWSLGELNRTDIHKWAKLIPRQ